MKKVFLFLSLIAVTGSVMAQKLTTTSAVITFDATTPKDALTKATNNAVIASLDKTSGVVMFEAAVNNFAFSNPTMQTHFNSDNWMKSATFPKFTFSGNITKPKEIKYNKNGRYAVKVSGNLTIRDVTKPVTTEVLFIVKDGVATASTSFTIKLSDFNISGQPVEAGKVAKQPKISVSATF